MLELFFYRTLRVTKFTGLVIALFITPIIGGFLLLFRFKKNCVRYHSEGIKDKKTDVWYLGKVITLSFGTVLLTAVNILVMYSVYYSLTSVFINTFAL